MIIIEVLCAIFFSIYLSILILERKQPSIKCYGLSDLYIRIGVLILIFAALFLR